MLTDQQGLFDADPRAHLDAKLVEETDAHNTALDAMVSEGSTLGRGGMVSKLRAARLAARSGTVSIIADGRDPRSVSGATQGLAVGTLFTTAQQPQPARKQWLASLLYPRGELVLDDGACRVITTSGRSLLPVGVKSASGEFTRGDLVRCVNGDGEEIARGLINYGSEDAQRLLGRSSADIEAILGFGGEEELIHRDNLITVR